MDREEDRMRFAAAIAILAVVGCVTAQQPPTAKLIPPVGNIKAGAKFKATVQVVIPPGLHAYSNPPTEEGLIPLEVTAVKGAKLLKVTYPKSQPLQFAGHEVGAYEGSVKIALDLQLDKAAKGSLEVTVHYQLCNDQQCFMPGDIVAKGQIKLAKGKSRAEDDPTIASTIGGEEGIAASLAQWRKEGKWYLLIPAFLLVGLLINLTPCVYPVIAPTAGFIAKQSQGAGRFGFGLTFLIGSAVVFGAIGTIFSLSGAVFGSLYQKPWFTIGLGVLMLVLALSMFDVYQIKLPGSLASGARGRAGLLGALVMGMFIGVAAVPCGGPVIASAAATVLQTGDTAFGIVAFTTIGIGLGLPVALLIFTGAGNVLARPGEWMTTVKHVLGLAVIASGIYFLSFTLKPAIGDIGMAWVWVSFFLVAAFYLLALDHSGRTRTGILAFKSVVAIGGVMYAGLLVQSTQQAPIARSDEVNWQALDLAAFDNVLGKGKPVIVDFTADWCAKCKEIERETFSQPDVKRALGEMVLFRGDQTGGGPTVDAWNKRFGVTALPDVLIFDESGKLVRRFKTFFDPDEFFEAAAAAGVTTNREIASSGNSSWPGFAPGFEKGPPSQCPRVSN